MGGRKWEKWLERKRVVCVSGSMGGVRGGRRRENPQKEREKKKKKKTPKKKEK